MPEVLKGGMAGCGWFAQRHLEAWRRIPGVEIVAAADPRRERAAAFASRAYASAEEMLERERLDFVDIATRADEHLALVRLAAARRIPIVCQKPLAPGWAEAREIVEMAESAGVPLMVHDNWRWHPWYRVARRMIDAGEIGTPIGYGFRSRMRDGLGLEPYATQAYFRGLPRFIIDQVLVHQIDTARYLFGDIASVSAQAGRRNPGIVAEDWAHIFLTQRAGVHGWIDGNRFGETHPGGPAAGDAFFEGESAALSIHGSGDVYLGEKLAWRNQVAAGYRGDSVRATLDHFISCLRAHAPFETGGRAYLGTFAAVEAAYRSVAAGRRVELAEVDPALGAGAGAPTGKNRP